MQALPRAGIRYSSGVRVEPFHERFKRAISGKSLAEIEVATGMSRDKLRRLSDGTTKTIDLADGLRLAHFLQMSPYDLAGEPERSVARSPVASAFIAESPAVATANAAIAEATPPAPTSDETEVPAPIRAEMLLLEQRLIAQMQALLRQQAPLESLPGAVQVSAPARRKRAAGQ